MIEVLNPIIETGAMTILEGPLTVEDQVEFIRGFPERGVFHVAICGDSQRLVGLQDVTPISTTENALRHVGQIATFVALDAHRQGIGQSLSRATFPAASELGFTKLMATIRADNRRAVSFYRNQGFEVIGTARQHALVNGDYVDEIIAEKFLG